MDPEKRKALEERLLRLFEQQETEVVTKKPAAKGMGNVIRRRKGQPDKRVDLPGKNG